MWQASAVSFFIGVSGSVRLPYRPGPLGVQVLLRRVVRRVRYSFCGFFYVLCSFPFVSNFSGTAILCDFYLRGLYLSIFLFFRGGATCHYYPGIGPHHFRDPGSSTDFLGSNERLVVMSWSARWTDLAWPKRTGRLPKAVEVLCFFPTSRGTFSSTVKSFAGE